MLPRDKCDLTIRREQAHCVASRIKVLLLRSDLQPMSLFDCNRQGNVQVVFCWPPFTDIFSEINGPTDAPFESQAFKFLNVQKIDPPDSRRFEGLIQMSLSMKCQTILLETCSAQKKCLHFSSPTWNETGWYF